MPIRMLRDWTDSEKINSLSVHSERFFTRLIMKVDDYGCFYADTRLLKANLFPLLLDNIREADLLRWIAECEKAGLIVLYENSNKKYLQIKEFNQRMDRAKNKYPLPTSNDSRETVTTSGGSMAEYERKPNTNTKGKEPISNDFVWTDVVKYFFNDYNWKEKFCRDKFIEMDFLEKNMKTFISDQELKEDFKDLKEIKNHFTNWFNKNLKEKKIHGSSKANSAAKFLSGVKEDIAEFINTGAKDS